MSAEVIKISIDTESAANDAETSVKAFEEAIAAKGDFYATGPMCWGPVQWIALHQMARGYPLHSPAPEKQAAAKAYVIALADLLPCSICATHWRAIAPTIDTSSRNAFLKWTIDVHNSVNKRTKKAVLSYREAIDTIIFQCVDNCLSISTFREKSNPPTTPTAHCSKTAVTSLAATSALLALATVIFFVLFMHARRQAGVKISE